MNPSPRCLCHSFCDELDAFIVGTVREAPVPLRLDEVARAVQARDARLAWSMQLHVTPLGHLQEAVRAGRLHAVVGDDGIMRWTQ